MTEHITTTLASDDIALYGDLDIQDTGKILLKHFTYGDYDVSGNAAAEQYFLNHGAQIVTAEDGTRWLTGPCQIDAYQFKLYMEHHLYQAGASATSAGKVVPQLYSNKTFEPGALLHANAHVSNFYVYDTNIFYNRFEMAPGYDMTFARGASFAGYDLRDPDVQAYLKSQGAKFSDVDFPDTYPAECQVFSEHGLTLRHASEALKVSGEFSVSVDDMTKALGAPEDLDLAQRADIGQWQQEYSYYDLHANNDSFGVNVNYNMPTLHIEAPTDFAKGVTFDNTDLRNPVVQQYLESQGAVYTYHGNQLTISGNFTIDRDDLFNAVGNEGHAGNTGWLQYDNGFKQAITNIHAPDIPQPIDNTPKEPASNNGSDTESKPDDTATEQPLPEDGDSDTGDANQPTPQPAPVDGSSAVPSQDLTPGQPPVDLPDVPSASTGDMPHDMLQAAPSSSFFLAIVAVAMVFSAASVGMQKVTRAHGKAD